MLGTGRHRGFVNSPFGRWAGVLIVIVPAIAAQAQTETVLYNFTGGLDGALPYAGLVMDRAGNLYGTASAGGSKSCPGGCGTVFKLSPHGSGWILSTLYAFQGGADGQAPLAPVLIARDGTLYGTTFAGGGSSCVTEFGNGCGTVFRLRPQPNRCAAISCPWMETVVYRFSGGADGGNPDMGSVVLDTSGNLFGTTQIGGSAGQGTVFELTPSNGSWTQTVIHSFSGSDGVYPQSGVVMDAAGNLYGTADSSDGTGSGGTVYQLSRSGQTWNLTVLHTFSGSDGDPLAGLTLDAHGNLYSVTANLRGDPGWVYQLSYSGQEWEYSPLTSIPFGVALTGLAMDAAGNFCGALGDDVYKVTDSNGTWIFAVLYHFADGSFLNGVPLVDAKSDVYGTTLDGGSARQGTVYKISQP